MAVTGALPREGKREGRGDWLMPPAFIPSSIAIGADLVADKAEDDKEPRG